MAAIVELNSPLIWALLAVAAFIVGLSKGGLPGAGMLSVPILSLVMSPISAAVLLLPIYILSDVIAVWLYRREYSATNLQVLIPAGFLGVGVGWLTASMVSDAAVSLLIGLMGVVFCLDVWFGKRHREAPRASTIGKGIFWGTLSGFTSFVSHAGAPPYQVYVLPQKLTKMVFAGTSTIMFAAINLAKVVPYATLHPYTTEQIQCAALLLPAALVGTVAGRGLIRWMPEARFFLVVQIALFVICLRLIYSALLA